LGRPTAPGEPPRWHVSFTVADGDQTVADAERLGAQVLGRDDTEWARTALIRDRVHSGGAGPGHGVTVLRDAP